MPCPHFDPAAPPEAPAPAAPPSQHTAFNSYPSAAAWLPIIETGSTDADAPASPPSDPGPEVVRVVTSHRQTL